MNSAQIVAIIPARYASTRFPGKPLIDLGGKSMIHRVYEQTQKVIGNVYVATDDDRIYNAVKAFGGNVVMTSDQHQSGTDRCAEAYSIIKNDLKKDFDVVVNIQGDEPFIDPKQIEMLCQSFKNESIDISTLVKAITSNEMVFDANKPKVVIGTNNQALYFSRSPIPYLRGIDKAEWHLKHKYFQHVGLYAYRTHVLMELTKLKPSALELSESLEQLRWLENGFKIAVSETEHESIGIDSPDDVEKIKAMGLI